MGHEDLTERSYGLKPDLRGRLADYFASRYGDRSVERGSASTMIRGELFRRWAGAGKRILDVGCGSGVVTRFLVDGNRVTGIDVDKGALDVCGQRYNVHTVWADFTAELPFENATFHVVVAGETIEHLPYPKIFLEEVHRVLVTDGLFLGSVPNAYRYQNRLNVLLGRPFDRDPTHLQHFSLTSLVAMLQQWVAVEEVVPVRGRWAPLSPSLFAHYFAWRSRRLDRT